ncbi:MAG: alpha/beta hydrolase [Ferrovibrio sp.]|nr:MAG: alpha/beta hydrolase [Ferrovibrio sp.]
MPVRSKIKKAVTRAIKKPVAKLSSTRRTQKRKPINLALQGGGTHGAFTWGVLDRLLEADCFEIEGISGTSAGAMNAAVLAYGLHRGGPQMARASLRDFWKRVADAAALSPFRPTLLDQWFKFGGIDYSPSYQLMELSTKLASPYQTLTGGDNPLREILEATIDCDSLHDCISLKLFVCATDVLEGKIKVFQNQELSIDVLLASACLPQLFQAVKIGKSYYWDGGYMGNPPIFPIIYNCDCRDVLIVQINPMKIPGVPKTPQAILDRANTLSFNSSLVREMRAINFVTRLIESGFDDGGRLKHMLIHTIDAEEQLAAFGATSKYNVDWDFLQKLYALGRRQAATFLRRHLEGVGKVSTTDIAAKFL